jgi:transposase InsO family protein
MDHYARAYPVFSYIKGLGRFRHMLSSLKGYQKSEVAQKKLKILKFYDTYGEKAALEAFGASRKVIYRWKRRFEEEGRTLESLVPLSTRPHTLRKSHLPLEITRFIKSLREAHPRLGKEKIKPLLDEHCHRMGFKLVSESTIGNIIKRNKLFYQKAGRVYHDPGRWVRRSRMKIKRLRVRYLPKPKEFGHILSDTVERVTDGVKDYFLSAIDAKLKFAVTLNYKRLTSANMKDFYERFKSVYPAKITHWQTDNGPENLGEFDKALREDKIPHLFIYPHCPKINAYIERYNRTIQEEFIDNYLDIIHDKPLFNRALSDYLIFYNTKRIHKSLGKITPMDYFIKERGMSQMYLTRTSY